MKLEKLFFLQYRRYHYGRYRDVFGNNNNIYIGMYVFLINFFNSKKVISN